ncbi:MAG: beta-galactosidase [Actinobacteria bacterium]|nr:beta-galactosidase [Actinomycetota bacterium]
MDYRIKGQRLYLDDAPVSLFSGSYQYWRIEPDLWPRILEKVKGMGFDIIETYMPWSVHEVKKGVFDFGERSPNLDLPRFLGLCREAGFKVLARPGPHINAELTYFGYPERLFADADISSRSSDGTPVVLPVPPRMFPVPCYLHPRFLSEVRTYFSALSEATKEAVHPKGAIMAIQVDNECSKFFRTHPFDHDYSDNSIRLYRRFLREKYGNLKSLNRAYRSDHKSWQLIDPPRAFRAEKASDLPYHLDWVEYGEYYVLESLRLIVDIIRDCFGDGIPLFHNYPTVMPLTPLDIKGAEEFLDWQGVDSYPTKRQYHSLRRGIKYTSTVSRLPALMEFSSGPINLEDERLTTWATIMHGIKGINFYMIVERERWLGSPIRRDGSIRKEHYDFYKRFLSEVRSWGLEEMTPYRPVLLLINREYERLASASTLLFPLSSLFAEAIGSMKRPADLFIGDEDFGLGEPVAARYARLSSFWYFALSAAGVHFGIADDTADPGLLRRHPLVIMPTFEFCDTRLQERLLNYAAEDGCLLIGPRVPRLDSEMAPSSVLADHLQRPSSVRRNALVFGVPVDEISLFSDNGGAPEASMLYRKPVGRGCIVHLSMVPGEICDTAGAEPFRPMMDTLLRIAGVEPCFVPADHRIDVSLFAGDGGQMLMVANPTEESVTTEISRVGDVSFRDLRNGDNLGSGGVIDISLEPYTIRVFAEV